MAIEVIAKIKQKNNGAFKLIDSCDIEMANGQDLQTYIDNLEVGTSSVFEMEVDETVTDEYLLSVNLNEVANAYTSVYENLYLQFQTMFKEMQKTIDTQQNRIDELETRIFALESGSIKPPTYKDVILDYNGNPLLDYNGQPISEYEDIPITEYEGIVDYNNNPLTDYNGELLNDYKLTLKEEDFIDYNNGALEDYNGNILTDYGKVIYLVDYKNNYLTDYKNNRIYKKEGVI